MTGGRLARLADRRAQELFATAAGTPALVVAGRDAFPSKRAGGAAVVLSPAGGVAGLPDALPFGDGTFACVVDTTRPEEPAAHGHRLRELARVCRPGGVLATVACGGAPSVPVDGGARAFAASCGTLRDAGCALVRAVPFDVLGPLSPWRCALGERAAPVLAELDELLGFPAVRRAQRLLEREIVARLRPGEAGRVFLLARRGDAVADAAGPLADALASPALGEAALTLLHDDAVVRWAALLEAELVAPAGLPFDLVGWVDATSARPKLAGAADRAGRRRGRWRSPGFEAQRLLEALAHRLATQTIAALGTPPDPAPAGLAAMLEYDLAAAANAHLDQRLGTGGTI